MNHLLSSSFVGGTAVASVYYTTLAFGKDKDKTNQNTYQKLTFYITNKWILKKLKKQFLRKLQQFQNLKFLF